MDMDISIAIIGHGHRRYLDTLFSSIFGSAISRSFEVIFVENGVHDGSIEFIKERYPPVRLICNAQSYSFAKNNNIAFRASRGRYFLMLNPDTELKENSLNEMADFLDRTEGAGACGAKLFFPDGSLQLSCRRFPTVRSFLLRRTPLRMLTPRLRRDDKHLMAGFKHDKVRRVDWLLGACIMVRREVYEMIGGMDERFGMYCEDIDFCRRLHKAGWSVYYLPHAVVIHHHLAETDRTFFTRKTFRHYKSMFRYMCEHGIGIG